MQRFAHQWTGYQTADFQLTDIHSADLLDLFFCNDDDNTDALALDNDLEGRLTGPWIGLYGYLCFLLNN